MHINKWVDGYKVEFFPWIDRETYYFNVRYYKPGSSLNQPPVFDKSVFVKTNNPEKILMYLSTITNYVAQMKIIERRKYIIHI